jgi:hypothetical protein
MALDFQELHRQVKLIGSQAQEFSEIARANFERVSALLEQHAANPVALRDKALRVSGVVPNIRCALPEKEALNAHFSAPPFQAGGLLLAADGSQIFPDRHAAVNFTLVNVGALVLDLGACAAPQIINQCRLYYGADPYEDTNPAADVALERDLLERQVLAELVSRAEVELQRDAFPPVTLTDGTLELWGTRDHSGDGAAAFRKALETYKQTLFHLRDLGAVTAAYVDKPVANLVIKLFEIYALPDDQLDRAGKASVFPGVTDEALFTRILSTGERSAVFSIRSLSSGEYQGDLALHFFYLNVGLPESPWLVRVEIPAWVADSDVYLNRLHAVLVQQCRILGTSPYPYLLHRAHEAAVVTYAEKEQLTQMILHELRHKALPVGRVSHKQHAKNLTGRTRMK